MLLDGPLGYLFQRMVHVPEKEQKVKIKKKKRLKIRKGDPNLLDENIKADN